MKDEEETMQYLIRKYGIVEEGDIADLADLEAREEISTKASELKKNHLCGGSNG